MAIKARRVTHRSAEDGAKTNQDELTQATSKAVSFLNDNRKPLVFGGAATVLIFLGTLIVSHYWTARTEARSTLFTTALDRAAGQVKAPTAEESVFDDNGQLIPPPVDPKGKDPNEFTSFKERGEAAAKEYETFVTQYGSSSSLSVMAQAGIAASQAAAGKFPEAIKLYKELLEKSASSNIQLRFLLLDGLAAAHASSGDLEQAAKVYKELGDLSGDTFKDYAALRTGQLSLSAGKRDEARQTFQSAVEKYPTGPYRDELKKHLDLL